MLFWQYKLLALKSYKSLRQCAINTVFYLAIFLYVTWNNVVAGFFCAVLGRPECILAPSTPSALFVFLFEAFGVPSGPTSALGLCTQSVQTGVSHWHGMRKVRMWMAWAGSYYTRRDLVVYTELLFGHKDSSWFLPRYLFRHELLSVGMACDSGWN